VSARALLPAAFALALAGAHAVPAAVRPSPRPVFEVGADLSSLPQVQSRGASFRDRGRAADPLALLRARGFTAVRLRLWHSPADGACGLESTLALARRVHAAGLGLMLDLHYSDTWADPGHQSPPAAWTGLDPETLARSVHAYTRGVLEAFATQGTPPDYVQIGNEIDGGMLWETGRVRGADDTAGWDRLALLLAGAARGVRDGAPRARIVVHVARGGDTAGCRAFFDRLASARLDYDVIGVSYYPWWHGTLDALADNLGSLARRFGKDVMVVETAYPWTLRAFDAGHNLVGGRDQLLQPYTATAAGQAAFARDVRRVVAGVPDGHGAGVWWWEPAWIAGPGAGSPWENCALFDSAGVLLPAARALAR
jgi:arabinogalactan endo-1,4-beta-galactosidase